MQPNQNMAGQQMMAIPGQPMQPMQSATPIQPAMPVQPAAPQAILPGQQAANMNATAIGAAAITSQQVAQFRQIRKIQLRHRQRF